MADIVSPQQRSRLMAGIRSGDTKPELQLRRGLHRLGFRYRVHVKGIAGTPDLVFPKYSAIVFVNGCFWHGHDCALFKWPSTRIDFWREKITGNISRDAKVTSALQLEGWRVLTVWECAYKGPQRIGADAVSFRAREWLLSNEVRGEIKGQSQCQVHGSTYPI